MNNSFSDLKNKVCVITGGAGVIGTSIVEAMASAGIKTAILDLRVDIAEELAQSIEKKYGSRTIGIQGNVLDKTSLINARDVIEKELGPVDILINGAGGNSPYATTSAEQILENTTAMQDTFFGLKAEGFDKVFALNFTGTLLPSMVFGENMVNRGAGNILNISSMSSYKPLTKVPAYSAAKAAVNNFTQWLAVHFAKTGVRVNAISPGFFLTSQNRFLLIDEKTGELSERGKKIINNTPTGKFGEPEDLQGAVLYLLSDISKFVTGVILPVDGGYSAFGGV